MEFRKIKEIVEFNPTEHLKKGTVAKKISMEKLENFKKYIRSYDIEQYSGGTKFKNGDTLLARITPCLENGKTAKVTVLEKNEIGFGSTEYIVMRSIENVSDEDYIYYLAISPEFRNIAIKSMTGTSGRQRVQLDVVKNTKMKLSNYKEQVKIGKVLSVLDDKIQLNNQINDNLLNIGKTLIGNIFNEANNVIELKNVIRFIKGKKPKVISTVYNKDYLKYLTIACLNQQEENYADANNMVITNSDLLMVMDGASSGEIYCGDYGIVASTLAKIDIFNNVFLKGYIFFCIKKYTNLIKSKNTGSAIPHTDKTFVGNIEIPVIQKEQQNKFDIFLNKIIENQKQNQKLSQLRDTLLPKLMNGEIDLDKIEI